MLLLLLLNSHSWLDQESYDDGGIFPCLQCTAHEDKVPGPCREDVSRTLCSCFI